MNRIAAEEKIFDVIRYEIMSEDGLNRAERRIWQATMDHLKKAGNDAKKNQKRLAEIDRRLGFIVQAVADGMAFAAVKTEHDKLIAERKQIEASLNVIRIDSKTAAEAAASAMRAYRHIMRGLRSNGPKISAETTEMKRAITDLVGGRIDIVPREDGGLDAVMYGDYMAAFRIATAPKKNGPGSKARAVAESLVAGTRYPLYRNRRRWVRGNPAV